MPKPDSTRRNDSAQPANAPQVREPHPVFFCMLSTHKPTDSRVMFVTAETTSAARKLSFTPLANWDTESSVFGLVEFQKRYLNQVGWTADVWRGRKGNKPPEQLTVLHKMPATMPNWPKPQYKGFIKAVSRAFTDLVPAKLTHGERAWVAIQFAQNGMIRRGVPCPISKSETPMELSGATVVHQTENYWVWAEHLNRCTAQLTDRLSHPKKSNPLLSKLDLTHVMAWLEIKRPEIGLAVLEVFAAGISGEIVQVPEPHVLLAGSELPKRKATEQDLQVAAKVLAIFESGKGSTRVALSKAFPATQHVISWLFDANQLQTSPDGFIFTSDELTKYSQLLDLEFGAPAPSVRDIKDKLELPRKKAEQLRQLLVSQQQHPTPSRIEEDEFEDDDDEDYGDEDKE